MGTVRILFSFLLGLLILVAVPGVRTWAAQCPAGLPAIPAPEHASTGGQCHIQNTSDLHPRAPLTAAVSLPLAGPALCNLGTGAPQGHARAATGRLVVAVRGDMPILLRTGSLLI